MLTSPLVTYMGDAGVIHLVTSVIGLLRSSSMRVTPRLLRTCSAADVRSCRRHSLVAREPLGKKFLNMISFSGSLDPENRPMSWRGSGYSKDNGDSLLLTTAWKV